MPVESKSLPIARQVSQSPKNHSWAIDVLAEQGFKIDSSIFPISGHDRYGVPDAKKEIHTLETQHGSIKEFPPTAWQFGRIPLPVGGGYFRLFPLPLTSHAISKINAEGRPAMFYTHPWEFDPEQPRVPGLSKGTRFRHYVGLSKTVKRLEKMLDQSKFGTVTESINV